MPLMIFVFLDGVEFDGIVVVLSLSNVLFSGPSCPVRNEQQHETSAENASLSPDFTHHAIARIKIRVAVM